MIEYWDYWLYGYEQPSGGMGMATTLPVDPERDFAAELREAVKEATGKVVEEPAKLRMGFL